jgi:drug/metabolite transporter (DMT)-like permease
LRSLARPPSWKIALAFAVIYLVWGSTFLAIRVGVREVPPFLLAAMRFTVAGGFLYGAMRLKGIPGPTARQWGASVLLGTLIFVVDYGCLFWAERRIPSGIAAVILATIPVFITLLEILVLRTQRLTIRLILSLAAGLFGVAVLMNHSKSLGEVPIDRAGAVALLVAAFTWSLATIASRKLALPASKSMSSGAQMLAGGLQLFVVAVVAGELHDFHIAAVSWNAWFSLIYLIIAGSIVGFTAYIWLLHYESPTKVGTYAYVNPLVAVALGYLLGGEGLGLRTVLGTLFILASVIAITTTASAGNSRSEREQESEEKIKDLRVAEAE